jgi:hypothetical protein
MDLTLLKAVEDYVKQFGSVELSRNLGSPYFTCEINKVPTLIYPIFTLEGNDLIADLEIYKDRFKNSHKIVRLEVTIDEYGVALVKPVIMTDLVRNNLY